MNIKVNPNGNKVVEIQEDTVAILNKNIISGKTVVQLNQLDPLGNKDPHKFSSVFMTKEDILELAKTIKNL